MIRARSQRAERPAGNSLSLRALRFDLANNEVDRNRWHTKTDSIRFPLDGVTGIEWNDISLLDHTIIVSVLARDLMRCLISCAAVCLALLSGDCPAVDDVSPVALKSAWSQTIQVPGDSVRDFRLEQGQAVEINVRVVKPSLLPDNGRVRVQWTLLRPDDETQIPRGPKADQPAARDAKAFGIYRLPGVDWSKVLHALDADVYLNYRAPTAGVYRLTITPLEGDLDLFDGPRWREPGKAPRIAVIPRTVAWPKKATVDVSASLRTLDVSQSEKNRLAVELEPNDTPEQAQPIALRKTTEEYTFNVVGSSDDIEYFDNGIVGSSGDDWFRIEFPGPESRFMNACLTIPDQQVAARIRAYRIDPKKLKEHRNAKPDSLLPIVEYKDGMNENERSHQQTEQHRIAINRKLEPGQVYFLRVEANAPGYDLELRIVRPAPYDDPRRAVEQGLYDHIGQVDSWLVNRPRGASVERRIRDSGNLLGTNCMSCHTQSGIWGPSIPFSLGYRPQNVQPWRHLINTCYQSLRPTNELKDAANNTSLRPLDIGDGPAGTRVTGHAVMSLERFMSPRKLQGMQAHRAANYILLTSDPGGINAAGPGANVGQGVVFNYAGEIVWTAWKKTGEPRFFHSLESKARRMLKINLKFCDDLGHRIEFFSRYFPADYVQAATKVADEEKLTGDKRKQAIDVATALQKQIREQVAADLKRLRGIQLPGGGWSFDPGVTADKGKTWTVKDKKADPSPTALALIAFHAAGIKKEDPTVAKGLAQLLKLQHPTGYWKVASQTGMVSTAYALHALARYYPQEPPKFSAKQFQSAKNESLTATIRRIRDIAITQQAEFAPLLVNAADHESALVRYWALLGLGYTNTEQGVTPLIRGLGDPSKMVREAAHWGLRQTLIDEHGWPQTFKALSSNDDYVREGAMRTLVMKVDIVMPKTSLQHAQLTASLANGLNDDPHPAVRAWATRAAWQWWVWNPPVRDGLNQAWMRMLSRPESNALVENAIRYQSHALFIANGHIANGSKTHQYKQLAELFVGLHKTWKTSRAQNSQLHERLTQRLIAVASTFYSQRGGDGGPGQMGYVTPGAGELFGDVVLDYLAKVESLAKNDRYETLLQVTLEAAANVPHEGLQQKLVDYSINGPEKFRSLAASSISDPRLVSLIAVPEQLEPMYRQLLRGAQEPPRRKDLSDPILKMYGSVSWILPQTDEQRHEILVFMIPDVSAYRTAAELKSIGDAVIRAKAQRDSEAAWYLANGLGEAVAKNPDLHFDHLAESFPERFSNDAQARFWLQNVPWILEYKRKLPEVKVDPKKLPPIDKYEELRTRSLQLFLGQLSKNADPRNRKSAADLTNKTTLRRNPEVLTALAAMVEFETDKGIVDNAKKVLSQNNDTFGKDLVAAIKTERDHGFSLDKAGNSQPPEDFVNDVTYFRDYVIPEMTKVLRGDERSCMICHGKPGRVPSLELHAPDQVGYLPVVKLLSNYRKLQKRIDPSNLNASKLLRKPLNVQSGKEDGHQGGRRYQPNDPGYQILLRWAASQVEIQKRFGRGAKAAATPKK
jgi:hypothetical protein